MAQETINNGESGSIVRGKINDNFTELYTNSFDKTADSAADIPILDVAGNFTATTVEGALAENFLLVVNGKNTLEATITTKGGTVSKVGSVATFSELDSGIDSIPTSPVGIPNLNFKIFSVATQDSNPFAIDFNSDKSKMYISGFGKIVYQYTLSTPTDITTATYDGVSLSIDGLYGFIFGKNGERLYSINNTGNISQYNLSTAYDITTATLNTSFNTSAVTGTLYSIRVTMDGSKMYALGANNDAIFEFNLGTNYEINTATYSNNSFATGLTVASSIGGIFIDEVNNKLFVATSSTDRTIRQYSYDVATTINNAIYDNIGFSTSYRNTGLRGIIVDSNNIYHIDNTNDSVIQLTF